MGNCLESVLSESGTTFYYVYVSSCGKMTCLELGAGLFRVWIQVCIPLCEQMAEPQVGACRSIWSLNLPKTSSA